MKKELILSLIVFLLPLPSCNNENKESSFDSSTSIVETSQSSISSVSPSTSSLDSSSPSSIMPNPLQERKEEGLLELEEFFSTFIEDNYSSDNWLTLISTYEAGRITVEASTSIPEILSAISNTKGAIEAIEPLPIAIDLIDAKVTNNEYLNVFVNVPINRISNLLPVSNLLSSLKSIQFHTIEEIEAQTSITLKASAADLSKKEFTVEMDVSVSDSTISTLKFTILNGMLKSIENYRKYAINEINNFIANRKLIEDKYNSSTWLELQRYLRQGVDAINEATTYIDIESIINETKIMLYGVEQNGVTLFNFKSSAKSELTSHVNLKNKNLYHITKWDLITSLLNESKTLIDAKASRREVAEVLLTYLTKIDEVDRYQRVTIAPNAVSVHDEYYISIVYISFTYKSQYQISATLNGLEIIVNSSIAYGQSGMALQLQVNTKDLNNSDCTLIVSIIEGTTAHTSTIEILNGTWIK